MAGLRPQELIIILVIVLVLFGGNKLPELARSLGSAQREFKRGLDHGTDGGELGEDGPEAGPRGA